MALQDLTNVLRNQAADNQGHITINQATLDQAGLTYPAGLDALLAGGYALPGGQALVVDTTAHAIPNPVGNTLTVQGTTAVLSLTPATALVTMVFTADAKGEVAFTIRIDLSDWTFETSFPYLNGLPYTALSYGQPTFIFSSAHQDSWPWQPAPAAGIELVAGQNFAANLQLAQELAPFASFLSNLVPGEPFVLAGSFDLSKYAPDDEQDPVIYPDHDLNAPLTGGQLVPFSFLKVATPSIGFTVLSEEETDEDGTTQLVQTPELYLQLLVDVNGKPLAFRSGVSPQAGLFSFAIDAADITPQDIFALAGGQNYLQAMPALLQQFFNAVAFKGMGATVALVDGAVQVQTVAVKVGANVSAQQPWQVFGQPNLSITQLDLDWLVNNPGKNPSQLLTFEAAFNFFPTIFKGPFTLSITSDLLITGGFDGTVKLGDIVQGITGGAIALPSGLQADFSDFSVSLDLANRAYQFSGATEVAISLFGSSKFAIQDCSFYLGAVVPSGAGTTQFTAGIAGTVSVGLLSLELAADYQRGTDAPGWVLKAEQPAGHPLKLSEVLASFGSFGALPNELFPTDLTVNELLVEATLPATGGNSYQVSGQVQWDFSLSGAGQDVSILADIQLSYAGAEPAGQQFSGYVQGRLTLAAINAEVLIRYDFSSTDKLLTVQWAGFTAKYDITKSTLTFAIPSWNLGELITALMRMVRADHFELEAPWDLLNQVDLPALSVTYDFGPAKSVSATVMLPRTLNLVFVQLEGFTVTKNAKGTAIEFSGTYQGKAIGQGTPLDGPQDVENLPTPAGEGSQLLDLRLLALGQHVAIKGAAGFDSIEAAIAAMKAAITENPEAGTVPVAPEPPVGKPYFNEDSNWLIAADFGLLGYGGDKYAVDLQIVFNDPNLYGLRLALSGDKVKFLDGLAFEIMYKKITDSVGLYKAELTLPSIVRTFDVGAFAITLPSFGLEVYTNGDFKVDVGFPYNLDFSKSFTFQAIIMGVPVMGAGGFYFGKLSSATSTDVPQTTLGSFNPVLIFGLGMQLGLGRSVNYGVLTAGFSITIVGIIEGVIATWNPYAGTSSEHYYKVSGSLGLLGLLYGTIDFSIIKASVNVRVYVTIAATYESYRQMPLTIEAGVSVDVDVKIDLGLFSITLSFSFHMTIREELTIGSNSQAPWDAAPPLAGRQPLARGLAALAGQPLVFRRAALAAPQPLTIWFAPHLTVAGDQAGPKANQAAQYVALLYIGSPNAKAGVGAEPTDFENLATAVLTWVLSSQGGASSSVTVAQLQQVYTTLTQTERPLQKEAIMGFLQDNFTITVQGLAGNVENAAFFPMFPDFSLKTTSNGVDSPTISFLDYATVGTDYLAMLTSYFQQLEVQVDAEAAGTPVRKAAPEPAISLAQFVFEDYFSMLARQMVQAAQDCLRTYQHPLAPADSLASVAAYMTGPDYAPTATGLAAANAGVPLNPASRLQVTGLWLSPKASDTPASLAQAVPVDAAALLLLNQAAPDLLQPGAEVQYGANTHQVTAQDTFASVATSLGTTPESLAAAARTQQLAGLFRPGAPVLAAGLRSTVRTADSATTLAARFGAVTTELLLLNALVPQLLTPGRKLTYNGLDHYVTPGDTLATLAAAFALPLATLAALPAFQADTELLLPLATVLVPVLTISPLAGDTLQMLADRYGLPVASLFTWYQNAELPLLTTSSPVQVGLFDASVATLLLPEVQALELTALQAALRRSNTVASLAGLVSRFHLHGLRLPTAGISFQSPSAAPCRGDDCALYALTGQQVALPSFAAADTAPTFSLSLMKTGLDWIAFSAASPDTLLLPVPASQLALIQKVVEYARTTGVQPPITALEPGGVFREDASTYNFAAPINWQAAGNIALPAGGAAGGQLAPQLRLWAFPDNLLQLLQGPRAAPSCSIRIGSKNQPSGPTTPQSQAYAWSTLVNFSLRRLAGTATTGQNTAFTYELIGATQTGITLLERLLGTISAGSHPGLDNLRLLYSPNPTGPLDGLLSDDDGQVDAFLVQSNLSTFTNPASPRRLLDSELLVTEPAPPTAIRNDFYDFLLLLWEASITRSGGFYLYYHQRTENRGLPDGIFDKNGEATLSLLITHKAPQVLASYLNYALTADTITLSSAVVYARTEPQSVSVAYDGTRSLSALALAYNATPIDLAEANATVPLSAGSLVLDLPGIALSVGPPGSTPAPTLAGLASYFGVGQPQLQALNPTISEWNPVPLFSLVVIPDVRYAVVAGDTLYSLAAYYKLPVGQIGWANRDKPAFFQAAATLTIDNQPVQRTPLSPQGSVGLDLRRTPAPPVPAPTDPAYADALLQNLYSMLAYSLVATPGFRAVSGGLPASPSKNLDGAALSAAAGLVRADASDWEFRLTAPVASYAIDNPIPASQAGGLPPAQGNPYAGVGQLAQLHLLWADYFGNYTVSPLSQPAPTEKFLNNPVIPVGYTDALLGFGAWPGLVLSYSYDAGRVLTVVLHFDASRYQPASGDPAWPQHAAQDLRVYEQLYYQLNQVYAKNGQLTNTVQLALTSTLDPATDGTFSASEMKATLVYVNAIYGFLAAAAQQQAPTPPTDVKLVRTVDPDDINPASIFELTVVLTLQRDLAYVHPEFRDQPQVTSAATVVRPPVAQLAATAESATLEAFAAGFEEAFAMAGSYQLKLAVGIDKKGLTNSAVQELWVVRLGLVATQSIWVQAATAPQFFALPPLSTNLESHAVQVYPYVTGQGLQSAVSCNFSGIDMDAWARNFFQAVDDFLTADYSTAAFIIDNATGATGAASLLTQLQDAKKQLAQAVAQRLQAVFDGANPTAEALLEAREALAQQMLVLLSAAFNVTAVVQYPVAAATNFPPPAQAGDLTPPRFYGTPTATLTGASNPDASFSLTPAKIQLPSQQAVGESYLTFLLSAKDVQLNAYLELAMSYTTTHVEFQVQAVPGISDYQASSWLAFLRPAAPLGAAAPLVQPLGSAAVPLVLRAYPTPPSLIAQNALPYAGSTLENPAARLIADATAWTLDFEFSHDNAAQDQFNGQMEFNLPGTESWLTAFAIPARSIFEELASFTYAYPAVRQDLDNYLAHINFQTSASSTQFINAQAALTAFCTLVTNVQKAWQYGQVLPASPARERDFTSDLVPSALPVPYAYSYSMVQQSNAQKLLQVTLSQSPSSGPPLLPVVNIPGYKPQLVPSSDNSWTYVSLTDGLPLTYQAGLEIPLRCIDTEGLSVLKYQNAKTTIAVTRNAELAGQKVAAAFVYTTPAVSFPSNVVPLLDSSQAIHVLDLLPAPGPYPLWKLLQAFFATLFADSILPQQTLMLECRYRYPFPGGAVQVGLPDVELPVSLVLPFPLQVPGDYQPSTGTCVVPADAAFVCRLAGSILTWWRSQQPQDTAGAFWFDIALFSELDQVKLPVARLRQVTIEAAQIQELVSPPTLGAVESLSQ